jgi:formate hydrogenlyase subunit 6/NADH:ubiquinone oxidoreductase subunit I
MLDRLLRAWRTGIVTARYPAEPPVLEPAVRGLPELDPGRCTREAACATACPTGAITLAADAWIVDAGRCVMCGACARACPTEAIRLGVQVTLAATTPDGLLHVTPLRLVAKAAEGTR